MKKRLEAIIYLSDCDQQELEKIYANLKHENAPICLLDLLTQILASAP